MEPGKLTGRVIPIPDLTSREEETLYKLLERYYDNVRGEDFLADLREKHWILLLEDAWSHEIQGFSTILQMEAHLENQPLKAVFSGDTIIDRSYWGQQELVRTWCSFMGTLKNLYPTTKLYWFLISKGYRTYLFLPLYFHDFYPRFDCETPPFERALIDELGARKFPHHYQPTSGLIRFEQPRGNLKLDLATIPARRLRDPHVRFFLEKNPDYARGDELACLAEISPENMRALARRMVSAAVSVRLA